jgi:hypothetical protein
MFGYDGETQDRLIPMLALRRAAQLEWPFLTTLDLSMIHNDVQLASVVKDRTAVSRDEAEASVRAWSSQNINVETNRLIGLQRWSDDGGAARAKATH